MRTLSPVLLAFGLAASLPARPVAAAEPGDAPAQPQPEAPPPQAAPQPTPEPLPPLRGAPPATAPRSRLYRVERIDVVGLRHTHASEVRRYLLVAEGDPLDTERVLLSRLRLLQLGWFSRVEVRVERGSERGQVVVVFEVTERNTLVVTDLIIGGTPAQPIYGGLGLSQQNFLGRGYGLSGAFVAGGSPAGRPSDPARFAARAGFFAPDLAVGGLPPLVVGVSGLFLRGEEFSCADPDCKPYSHDYGTAPRTRYQRAGGEATLGIRAGPFERLLATWRVERVHAEKLAGDPALAAGEGMGVPVLPGWSTLSALTGTYEADTRDDFFYPTDGFRGVAQVTFGSALLGGDYEYSRYLLQLETAFGLLGVPLRFQGTLGAAQGSAPFFERFYGADFSYFAIGPALGRALELNFSTDSRYDVFLAMGGLEYGVPLWSGSGFFRRGYVALGVRGVYSTSTLGGSRTPFSRSPVSADVALRLDTPVGTFNASLGYALDIFL